MNTTFQPTCLRWARERAGLSTDDLASKLGVSQDKVSAWEVSGELTLSLAEKLANATHTPLGYLFLSEPPVENLPIRDFRTVGAQVASRPSPDLLDTIYDALRRQEWYRDYLVASAGEPLEFVGSLQVSEDILTSAERIRSLIAWDAGSRAQASSWEIALSKQIEAVEEIGVLVMRSGIVGNNTHRPLSVSEFRGFALSDEYAPIVFINSRDAKAAQMFTLAHELVHILLGVSGVSNLNRTYPSQDSTERFCNAVAAELLVPLSDLRIQWAGVHTYPDWIARLTRYFKVSSLVILRRLHDAGYLAREEFDKLYNDELAQFTPKLRKNEGGDFYLTLCARLGGRFVSALVESTLEGRTQYRDAFHLLGVAKADTVHTLAQRIGVMA